MQNNLPVLSLLHARIYPQKIAFLKFILEGYDGLAVLSTVDRTTGLIVVRFSPENSELLFSLLDSLRVQTGLQMTI